MDPSAFPLRALNRWWRAAIADQGTAEEVRDDDTGLADGLVLVAIASLVLAFTQGSGWISYALAVPVGLAGAAVYGLALAVTTRWVKSQTTWWEATTVISITALPLLLAVIPTVGVFIGGIAWLTASILFLRHISYVSMNDAALAVLLALAITVMLSLGLVFLINAAL
ncbi:MAG TPA: hypothetical protein VIW46_14235 [Acidimicrobiia bacterium]|jgi:hypothetical protein